jgi:hypothetical protein
MTLSSQDQSNKPKRRLFRNPPSAKFEAQAALIKHGLSKSHTLAYLDLWAAWDMEPNKPISLTDLQRLNGPTRKVWRELLTVLCEEQGLEKERVQKHSGRDAGYVLRRRSQGMKNQVGTSAEAVSERHEQTTDVSQRYGEAIRGCAVGTTHLAPGDHTSDPVGPAPGDHLQEPSKNLYQEPLTRTNKDLSHTAFAERPIARGLAIEMIRGAVEVYDQQQATFGGRVSDAQTVATLINQAVGLADDVISERLGIGLGRACGQHWYYERPSPHDAGKQLCAALQGHFNALDDDHCPPDASKSFLWDSQARVFVDELGFDPKGANTGIPVVSEPDDIQEQAGLYEASSFSKRKLPETQEHVLEVPCQEVMAKPLSIEAPEALLKPQAPAAPSDLAGQLRQLQRMGLAPSAAKPPTQLEPMPANLGEDDPLWAKLCRPKAQPSNTANRVTVAIGSGWDADAAGDDPHWAPRQTIPADW